MAAAKRQVEQQAMSDKSNDENTTEEKTDGKISQGAY